jgi:hypothetical protein
VRRREQEDLGSRPAQAKKHGFISKIPNTKQNAENWLKWYSACLASMRQSSKPQCCKKINS